MRPDYSSIALEIILNDQAYRDAKEELARWETRKQEAERRMAEIKLSLVRYDTRLNTLSQRISERV